MTTSIVTTAPASRRDFIDARPETTIDLGVQIGSLRLRNPIMPASGCFGPELGRLIPSSEIGAAVTKTVFHDARGGNPVHRLTEIDAGMVNSVGIPSRGPAGYLEELHPQYVALDTPTIVSVGGHRVHEYAPLVEALGGAGDAYELNVSCPNLDREGTDIGSDPDAVLAVVRAVRAITDRPLIVKLPAMVASIAESAIAAQEGGADAIAVSNSIPSLPLDRSRGRRPALGNIVGGLSGPAIRPIVTRLVWQSARAVSIPVIACGGVETAEDALDYFSVGATAIQVGTANFARPYAMVAIARELQERCARAGVSDIRALLAIEETS